MTNRARAGERATRHSWTFDAALWRWRDGTWHFATVPDDVSDEIDEISAGTAGGFGSVRVEVRCATTVWRTSLFPSKEHRAFVLPVKAAVRKAQGLSERDLARFTVTLVQ